MPSEAYFSAIRSNTESLSLTLASTSEEVRAVQRLRYRVFIESAGLYDQANASGLDADEFDAYCDHLIVRDSVTDMVVGTYRLLSPNGAKDFGRYYSENEFDLTRLKSLNDVMVEAGRACIDPHFRSGAVLMLLWSGLAAYMRLHRCEYLMGCASISLADGGSNASSVFRELDDAQLAPPEYHVVPHVPLPLTDEAYAQPGRTPPLLRGYLRSGAWVCGAPAWDRKFQCADLFLLLPLSRLESRYARRYVKE